MTRTLVAAVMAVMAAIAIGCADGGDDCPIRCNDGWCSHAQNTQGACSSHGGIKSKISTSLMAPSL